LGLKSLGIGEPGGAATKRSTSKKEAVATKTARAAGSRDIRGGIEIRRSKSNGTGGTLSWSNRKKGGGKRKEERWCGRGGASEGPG